MRSHSPGRTRAAAVALLLLANLVTAGLPVLHALAHERGEGHAAPERSGPASLDHGHEEIHAEGLHHDPVLAKRQSLDLWFVPPRATTGLPVAPQRRVVVRHVAYVPGSRAPPPTVPARAPPLG